MLSDECPPYGSKKSKECTHSHDLIVPVGLQSVVSSSKSIPAAAKAAPDGEDAAQSMTNSTIEAVRLGDIALNDSPIEPAWILEGDPRARVAEWSKSIDGTTTTNVWDCTAGRFRWYFAVDEIVHIMDGSVTVSSENHAPRTLVAGDAALFRAGTWSEWHVENYVRKHAILRQHLPAPVCFAMKVSGALRHRIGRWASRSADSRRSSAL